MSVSPAVSSFAYRVSGPIDAAINLVLNTAIPWYFLRAATAVPLVGLPSLYAFIGPMVFCAIFFPSWFGYANGLRITTGRAMFTSGLARALSLAALGSALLGAAVFVLHRSWPDWQISAVAIILIDGVGSMALAYWMQVAGVFASERDVARRGPSTSA